MKTSILLATLAIFGLQTVQAHRAWILPSSTVLSGGETWVTFDACSSNNIFFVNHRPMRTDSITATAPDGKPVELQNLTEGALRTTFDLELKQEGTYAVGVIRSGLMAFWREGEERKRWTGTKEELISQAITKKEGVRISDGGSAIISYVTLGKPSPVTSTGKGLEVTFKDSHPNDLFAKETSNLVFQLNGQPAANLEVSIIRDGDRYRNDVEEIKLKTNEKGECSVTWPVAGRYWLNTSAEGEGETIDGASVSKRASLALTLEVFPE